MTDSWVSPLVSELPDTRGLGAWWAKNWIHSLTNGSWEMKVHKFSRNTICTC